MVLSGDPISANATHKALTPHETEGSDAAALSEERAELDAEELRELERAELYPEEATTADRPEPARRGVWQRLFRRGT